MTLRMGIKSGFALAVVAIGMMAGAQSAHAMGISLVGDYAMANVAVTPSPGTSTSNTGFGGGLLLNLGSGHVGFELGGIYSPRGYVLSSVITNANFVRVPAMLTLNAGILHLGAGGYYGMLIGQPTLGGVAASGIASSDYGAEGAAGFHIPLGKLKFVAEGRYVYGLANASTTAGVTANWRNFEVLAGFHFGM